MSDDQGDRLRRDAELKLPAILVPSGADANDALRGVINDPVRLPVQIRRRTTNPAVRQPEPGTNGT
jgi:hypothetical protein